MPSAIDDDGIVETARLTGDTAASSRSAAPCALGCGELRMLARG
jgi:hypothetical protein